MGNFEVVDVRSVRSPEVIQRAEEMNVDRSSEMTTVSVEPTRRHRRILLLVLAFSTLLVAVGGGVMYALTRGQQPGEYATDSGNRALNIGLTASHSVVEDAQRVGMSAELINNSPLTLQVEGSIGVSGIEADSGVHLLYAQLADDPALIARVPAEAPPALLDISPGERVPVVVGLEVDCRLWRERGEWPSAEESVTIGLAGFDTPAIYSFTHLFGNETGSRIRELCSQS